MVGPENALTFQHLFLGTLFHLVLGMLLFASGKQLPSNGRWISFFGFFLSAALGISGMVDQLNRRFETWVWEYQWAEVAAQFNSIQVGIFQDLAASTVISFIALISLTLISNIRLFASEPKPHYHFAAIHFGFAGVSLAWLSVTPWFTLLGTAIAFGGCVLSFGNYWANDSAEPRFPTRYLMNHSMALIFTAIGICILVTAIHEVRFDQSEVWYPFLNIQIGAIFTLLGCFFHFRSFPFIGWIATSSRTPLPFSAWISFVFPVWAVFALILRFETHFREVDVFPAFGWVALVSGVLTLFSGLFQKDWKKGVVALGPAFFCFSLTAASFAGVSSSLSILMGSTLSYSALVLGIHLLTTSSSVGATPQQKKKGGYDPGLRTKQLWLKSLCLVSMVSLSGVFGSLSSEGFFELFVGLENHVFTLSFVAIFYVLYVFLIWKPLGPILRGSASLSPSSPSSSRPGTLIWSDVFTPFLLILLSVGFFWKGQFAPTLIYSLFKKKLDLVFPSFQDQLLQESAFSQSQLMEHWARTEISPLIGWTFLGVLAAGVLAAFWSQRFWTRYESSSKTGRFLKVFQRSYYIDEMTHVILTKFGLFGARFEESFGRKIWQEGLPRQVLRGATSLSRKCVWLEQLFAEVAGKGFSRFSEISGKTLQIVQSGNVQWYLFLGVLIGVALMLHFLRV